MSFAHTIDLDHQPLQKTHPPTTQIRLGTGDGVESGNPATDLPGPFSALQCDARRAWFADGQDDRYASGAARQSARAEFAR